MSANGIVNIRVYLALPAFIDTDLYIADIVAVVIVCIAVYFFVGIDSVSLPFASLCFRC